MKKSFNTFIHMLYLLMISLFLRCFVEAFVEGAFYESLLSITGIMTIIFGILAALGLIYDFVYMIKDIKENKF